ncbi:DNA-binding MarR family transcriptional regulator [Paenibacillus wynnii]|nr:DNA-binding MarR family transcriptional regulator [Paenibacillus wynnii]
MNELGLNSQQGRMIGYIQENQDKGVIQKDLAEEFNRKGPALPVWSKVLRKKGISSV